MQNLQRNNGREQYTGCAKKTANSEWAIILAASKKFNQCEVRKDRGLDEPYD